MTPSPITPTPSDAPVGQQKKGAASNAAVIPFARSSKWHIEQANSFNGIALNAAAPQTFNFPLPSYGYLCATAVTVTATGGVTTVNAVGFEDAPWSVFSSVVLTDVNGVPIWQLPGYSSYVLSKWGGFRLFGLDLSTFAYQAVQTSGNFKFVLLIYNTFGRDNMGALPNMDASARYNLALTIPGGAATVAATGPLYTAGTFTSLPTLSILVEGLYKSSPPATDMYGNRNSVAPPAVGTVRYATQQVFSGLANGANTLQLSRVGNLIRNHILIWRNTNGTRASAEGADVPATFEFDWDAGIRYIAQTQTLRQLQFLSSGYDVPNGVLVFANTYDPDMIAVSEYGDEWLPTVGASKLTFRYSSTAGAGTLAVITDDIVPASGQVYAAAGMAGGA